MPNRGPGHTLPHAQAPGACWPLARLRDELGCARPPGRQRQPPGRAGKLALLAGACSHSNKRHPTQSHAALPGRVPCQQQRSRSALHRLSSPSASRPGILSAVVPWHVVLPARTSTGVAKQWWPKQWWPHTDGVCGLGYGAARGAQRGERRDCCPTQRSSNRPRGAQSDDSGRCEPGLWLLIYYRGQHAPCFNRTGREKLALCCPFDLVGRWRQPRAAAACTTRCALSL